MKFLIIETYYPPFKNARSIQASRFVKALQDAGNDVFVVSGSTEGNSFKQANFISIRYKYSFIYKIFKKVGVDELLMSKSRFVRKSVDEIKNVLSNYHPDVVISMFSPIESHFIFLSILKFLPHKTIRCLYFSDLWPIYIRPVPYRMFDILYFWKKRILYNLFSNSDYVLTTNKYVVDYWQNKVPINKSMIRIINHISNEIDESKIINTEIENYLVYTGNLCRRRGSLVFLRALKKSFDTELNLKGLIVVGTVERKVVLRIKQLGLDSKIKFVKYIDNEALREYTDNSLANIVIEAFGMKKSPFIPSKFADYSSSKNLILAISPIESAIHDYSLSFNEVIFAEHKEDDIVKKIKKISQIDKGSIVYELHKQFQSKQVVNKFLFDINEKNK